MMSLSALDKEDPSRVAGSLFFADNHVNRRPSLVHWPDQGSAP